MKKTLSMLLSLALVLSMTACGGSTNSSSSTDDNNAGTAMSYTAGTYTGTANGHNGSVSVEVTFSDSAITDVKVGEHKETDGLTDAVMNRIPTRVVEQQALGLDALTGATITTNAVIAAIADAVDQAGGDSKALKAVKYSEPAGDAMDLTADVVIIGGGGAGIAAAASAAENGASVILLEKTAALGGNTLVAGGAWNAYYPEISNVVENDTGRNETLKAIAEMDESTIHEAFRPVHQAVKAQIETYLAGDTSKLFDSVELHIFQSYLGGVREDLDGGTIVNNLELLSFMCEQSAETVKWFESMGSTFDKTSLSEPIGAIWKRGVKPADKQVDYFELPLKYAEDRGAEVYYETTATELIVEDGKVVGVKATQKNGTEMTVHATKGVILATGGFGGNAEMVIEYNNYWNDLYPAIGTTNVSSTVGEGLKMAEVVDAALTNMEFTQLMPIGYANTGRLAFGAGSNVIFVNPEGNRYVNEYAERDVLSQAAFDNGGEQGLFYEISAQAVTPWRQAGVCWEADTIEELAAMINMDPAVLKQTVDTYNVCVETGVDAEYGKNVFSGKIEGPFVARQMKPSIHHTMGGLVIDTECHVYNNNGEVIPGLYAAGEVVGGIHAGNRLGGNAIADVFVYGRQAGTIVANSN